MRIDRDSVAALLTLLTHPRFGNVGVQNGNYSFVPPPTVARHLPLAYPELFKEDGPGVLDVALDNMRRIDEPTNMISRSDFLRGLVGEAQIAFQEMGNYVQFSDCADEIREALSVAQAMCEEA